MQEFFSTNWVGIRACRVELAKANVDRRCELRPEELQEIVHRCVMVKTKQTTTV